MAIRIALGATHESVMRLSVRATVVMGAAGALAGGLAALGATRALAPFLYGISAADPLTYGLVIGGALLIAAVAAWAPARRAARAQPAELLRVQ
jgi:ABC-type antimicrobial peptide transport system permease subunit